MPLDDLAGARIDDRCAIGPAAGLAVYPLDDVVARIQRVSAFGQKFDTEGIVIASCREGLGPPGRAFDQGVADQRRCTAVEIVDDRLDHRTVFGCRVNAFQPVPDGIGAAHRSVERCRHVVELGGDGAGPVVRLARCEAGGGQGDKGMVHGQRYRLRVGRDGPHFRTRIVGPQRQEGIDFNIQREGEGAVGQRGAAVGIDREIALSRRVQLAGRADGVAGQEAGHVDQHPALVFGDDVGAPDHRAGKGLPGRAGLVQIRTDSAITGVFELGKDPVVDPEEAQDLGFGPQATVQSDRIRAKPRGQAGRIDHAAQRAVILDGELGQDASVAGVDVQRDKAVATLQPLCAVAPVVGHGQRAGKKDGDRAADGAPEIAGIHLKLLS